MTLSKIADKVLGKTIPLKKTWKIKSIFQGKKVQFTKKYTWHKNVLTQKFLLQE